MRVTIKFFALLRELVGESSREVDVSPGTTLGALFDGIMAETTLPDLRTPILYAVNAEYQRRDYLLKDGDEVVFIPPVSGGVDIPPPYIDVTEEPISLDALIAKVQAHSNGAIVTFQGVVRNHAEGRGVHGLTYDAYVPMAMTQMKAVADEINQRFGVYHIAMVHRIGALTLGDVAVAIAAASPHRGEAFEACRYAIDRLKETVPIWKKEFYDDAEPIWK